MNMSIISYCKTMVSVVLLMAFSPLTGWASPVTISFSITGKPDSSTVAYGYGYNTGQSYTFTWVLNGGFTNNESSYFSSSWNGWTEDYSYEAPIFSDFSGDGLTGSLQRTVVSEGDPYCSLDVHGTWLDLGTSNEAVPTYSNGLQVDNEDIDWVYGTVALGDIFTYPGTYTHPIEYFTPFIGTYEPTGGNINIGLINGNTLYFSADSLTISQIPEPSSAALIVLATGGLAFIRRRLLI